MNILNRIFPVFAAVVLPMPVLGQDAAKPAEKATTTLDFDKLDPGTPPEEVAFVIDGDFEVVEQGENRVLEIAAAPLVESGALVGANLEGDVEISAKVLATKKGRSYPRFGIGTHGMSGYRLRIVPARKVIELVYREASVVDVPFAWESDKWVHLKLSVTRGEGDEWMISGKAWPEGEKEPAEATLERKDEELRGKGKSSIWGTPYSGTVISFDDVVVSGTPAP